MSINEGYFLITSHRTPHGGSFRKVIFAAALTVPNKCADNLIMDYRLCYLTPQNPVGKNSNQICSLANKLSRCIR